MDSVHTPPKGMLLRRTADGIPVLRLHYSADPDITPEWVAAQRKKYTSQVMWDLEMEINYEARSGQKVYPEYDPAIHVIPDSQIPRIGCLYMAIDPHPRTPHATLWLLIDEYSDWYIYRELWPSVFYGQPKVPSDDVVDPGYTVRDYAEAIAVLEGNELEFKYAGTDKERATYRRRTGGEKIITRLMDYAAKGFQASGESQEFESFADKFDRYGIRCINPIKAHDTGEDAIHSLLKPRFHHLYGKDWPRLHIAASCLELQYELSKHRYKGTPIWNRDRDLKQDGVQVRTHLIDDLRYLATGRLTYIRNLASEVNIQCK